MTDPVIQAASDAYAALAKERGMHQREVTVADLIGAVLIAVRPLILEWSGVCAKSFSQLTSIQLSQDYPQPITT